MEKTIMEIEGVETRRAPGVEKGRRRRRRGPHTLNAKREEERERNASAATGHNREVDRRLLLTHGPKEGKMVKEKRSNNCVCTN